MLYARMNGGAAGGRGQEPDPVQRYVEDALRAFGRQGVDYRAVAARKLGGAVALFRAGLRASRRVGVVSNSRSSAEYRVTDF